MGKEKNTKEKALAKLKMAKENKRACLNRLEKSMKEAYRERTGKDAENFFAL